MKRTILIAALLLAGCAQAPDLPSDPIVGGPLQLVPPEAESGPPLKATPPVRISCGRRDAMIASLGNSYGERRVATGLSPQGGLVEIFAAEDGATFTILVSRADGFACLLGFGTDWRPSIQEPKGPEA